jgi:C4-dicarboxylate-specific signal transduction histidine kinase
LWSKGQMDNFKPQIHAVSVDDLFGYLEKSFVSVKDIRFKFINQQNLALETDENYLQAIMYNLSANAVNALKQKSDATIEWRAFQEDGKTILSITDNGNGISDEHISTLDGSIIAANAKTGFGLHLIRDLAKAIRCSITVQTKAGEGTIFYLFR